MLKKQYKLDIHSGEISPNEFEVVEQITWDSGNSYNIKRFKGSKEEAERIVQQLSSYRKNQYEKMNKDK